MHITRHEADRAIRIRGAFTVGEAESLRQALMPVPAEASPMEIDLSDVDACDVAGLQILLSLRCSAERARVRLSVVSPSPAVAEACEAIGLTFDAISHEKANPDEI